MSYGVSLESMMIPDVGNEYPAELAALENWVITMESQLIAEDVAYCAAMEAEGADVPGVSPSSFVTRIRTAFDNLRAGKKKGDNSAVAAATQEIQAASDEFAEEAEKETDPDKKKKWKKKPPSIDQWRGLSFILIHALVSSTVTFPRYLLE